MADTSSQARWTSVFAHKFLPRVILDDEMSGKLLEIFANPEAADPLLNFLIDNVALACGFPEGTWKTLALDVHLHRRRFGAAEGIVIEMPPPQNSARLLFYRHRPDDEGPGSLFHARIHLDPAPDHAVRMAARRIARQFRTGSAAGHRLVRDCRERKPGRQRRRLTPPSRPASGLAGNNSLRSVPKHWPRFR